MLHEKEIELKSLLSNQQFFNLLDSHFSETEAITQINTYYDSPQNLLKKQNAALRTREIGNNRVLTLKIKVGPLQADEYTVPLLNNLQDTINLHPNLKEKLPCDPKELYTIVSFTTKRYQKQLSFGLLCLDMTTFSNGTSDFEVEIEITDTADVTFVHQWLENNNIQYTAALPKIARALAQQSL